MANTGAQLGQTYQTVMPAYTDNADIQAAMKMLWYGDANANAPTGKGIEAYLSQLSGNVNTVAAKKTTDIIFSPTAPARDTTNYSDWIWVNTSTTTPDGASRPVYMWNGTAWAQVAGAADPSANYTWLGNHVFNKALVVKGALNSFATATDRSNALPNVTNGTLSYINGRYEYYRDGTWLAMGATEKTVTQKSAQSTNMVESDADQVLQFTYNGPATYTVTTNQIKTGVSIVVNRNAAANLTIQAGTGVTLLTRNNVLGQYATVTLTKVGTDTWIMHNGSASIPSGGTANQALLKVDGADYNTQWTTVVPASGGTFTGDVNFNKIAASTANVTNLNVSGTAAVQNGGLSIGGHKVFVQATQPTNMVAGDVWIQI